MAVPICSDAVHVEATKGRHWLGGPVDADHGTLAPEGSVKIRQSREVALPRESERGIR